MRIVFMGTPEFSVPTLDALMAARHEVVAVYSQPPRPAGRGMTATKSPVHVRADRHGIAVFTPVSLKTAEDAETFVGHAADVAVVVAYGLILPKAILNAPRYGCLNLHASALPRWRGAAPIQRAIMAGDTATAVMMMQMEPGLDTGPVCAAEAVAILPDMTAGELHDVLARQGAPLAVAALDRLAHGGLTSTPQAQDGVTYAAKIDKAEARLDFTLPAALVHNRIRGLSPFPGAWFEVATGSTSERVKVMRAQRIDGAAPPGTVIDDTLAIACGSGAVRLTELQRAGKRPVAAADFLRGFPIPAGSRIG